MPDMAQGSIETTTIQGGLNMISQLKRAQIKQLLSEGRSIKDISRTCYVTRSVIRRIKRGQNPSSKKGRIYVLLEKYRQQIREMFFECKQNCAALERHVPKIIGEPAHRRTLQRFCREFREEARQDSHKKTGRFDTDPGVQLQIDFGQLDVKIGSNICKLHIFCCKLGYSRKIYAKAYYSENQDAWLDGIESSFYFYGGLPIEIVCDNSKCLVKDRTLDIDERFTERYRWFCEYYGVIPVATQIRKPNAKGKVEAAVKYVKMNAFAGEKFESLEDVNIWLEEWCVTYSDKRVLNDTNIKGAKTPELRWVEEKPALRKFNKPRIANTRREERSIDRNGLIRVDNTLYRVPDSLANQKVQVIIGKDAISILRPGMEAYNIDKAKDEFTPKQQHTSIVSGQEEKFKETMEKLQKNEQWQQMQKPDVQRPSSEYDCIFGVLKDNGRKETD